MVVITYMLTASISVPTYALGICHCTITYRFFDSSPMLLGDVTPAPRPPAYPLTPSAVIPNHSLTHDVGRIHAALGAARPSASSPTRSATDSARYMW